MKALAIVWIVLLAALAVFTPAPLPAAGQNATPATNPADAVFEVSVLDRQPVPDGIYHERNRGTGFFIAADGTALTAATNQRAKQWRF